MRRALNAAAIIAAAAIGLGGCAVAPPVGPTVAAMPGKGKDFASFQADDGVCRQYASAQIGNNSPEGAANASAVNSSILGTFLGAAAGAAIGAAAGNPAAGAAIGAGSGLFLGGTSGIGAAQASGAALQYRYDLGYAQCMAANGESVPTPGTASPGAPYYGGSPYPYYPYAPSSYPYPYYPYSFGPAFFGVNFGVVGRGGRGVHRGGRFNRFQHFHH
jgi:Glycine-zipper domain